MEPLNFEDNIRQKLQDREITPSEKAWSTLANKLDAQEKKNKSTFFWFSIAATLITILVVASLVFKHESINTNTSPIVVENPNNKTIKTNKKPLKTEIPVKEEVVSVKEGISQTPSKTEKNVVSTKKIIPQHKLKNQQTNTLATATNKEEELEADTKKQMLAISNDKKENIIDEKVSDVVSQIEELKTKNNNVSMAEIDSLLKKAQREIQIQKIIQSKKVDANQLLAEVEMDMYNSFKNKVFLALGEGFEFVKDAVANRNQ